MKAHQRSLDLSEDEQSYLIEVVEQWADTRVPSHVFPPKESQLREPTHRALAGLPSILAEIKIPQSIGEKLYQKVQNLNESGIPGFNLIAGLVKAMPNGFDDLAILMRTGLASESEDLAKNAVQGLHFWLEMTTEARSPLREPPGDLIREIGVMIATRRKVCLGQALQIAKWVFDEGSDAQKEAIRGLALQGLGYLVEELRYDREYDRDDDIDVPLLRWRSAQLAMSMATQGSEDAPAVSRWLEIVEEDPLPEVRYAKRPRFARRPEKGENVDVGSDFHTE